MKKSARICKRSLNFHIFCWTLKKQHASWVKAPENLLLISKLLPIGYLLVEDSETFGWSELWLIQVPSLL